MIGEQKREFLTLQRIEDFLEDSSNRGCGLSCIKSYRKVLTDLYDFMPGVRSGNPTGASPEGKWITDETGPSWSSWMRAQGLSPRTVNTKISAWNSFVKYLGHKEWAMDDFIEIEDENQPELTRAEYLRLLSTAREQGKDRTYMLIKTMGGAGLRVQELPQLTVEAVREGEVLLERHNKKQSRILRLPPVLKNELQEYSKRNGIKGGPVFVTSNGKPLPRSAIDNSISLLSRDARVESEKANPRCLRHMYEDTQKNIQTNMMVLMEQLYEQMLEQEEISIRWGETQYRAQ